MKLDRMGVSNIWAVNRSTMLVKQVRIIRLLMLLLGVAPWTLLRAQSVVNDSVVKIEVVGRGMNPNLARADAIRRALQQAFSQLVIADRMIAGDSIVKDVVLSTANGFVEAFEQLALQQSADGMEMRARVTVRPSSISSFIAYNRPGSRSVEVDGASILARVDAARVRREADALIMKRLQEGYPEKVISGSVVRIEQDAKSPDSLQLTLRLEIDTNWVRQVIAGAQAIGAKPTKYCQNNCIDFPLGSEFIKNNNGAPTRQPLLLQLPDIGRTFWSKQWRRRSLVDPEVAARLDQRQAEELDSILTIGIAIYSDRRLLAWTAAGMFQNRGRTCEDTYTRQQILNLSSCYPTGPSEMKIRTISAQFFEGAKSVKVAVFTLPQLAFGEHGGSPYDYAGRLNYTPAAETLLEQVTGIRWRFDESKRQWVAPE